MIDAAGVSRLLEDELKQITDPLVANHIRSMLVDPECVDRDWPWNKQRESYPCWTVLKHKPSRTGIAYCEHGFGPRDPWGLIFLDPAKDIGGDYSWYSRFSFAYWESRAPSELPVWQVFANRPGEAAVPITSEDTWEATWAKVEALRKSDPASKYNCRSGRGPDEIT